MDHVVRTLLARVATLGIRMKLLLLDRGFYSVRVIQDLITAALPFIMPAVKRGKKPAAPGGPTGTYALAAAKHSHWTIYTVKSPQEGRVDFDLAVVCHNTRGQRGRHQREALLSATWGVKSRPLSWIRQTYRARFGIEAAYRPLHQARIRTSSRNPALRLLFVGVALVLRTVWVWLPAEVLAEPRRGARQLRLGALRFARLLLWLIMEVAHHYRLLRKLPVYQDFYERAQAFGIIFNY
jgi:putative transposase